MAATETETASGRKREAQGLGALRGAQGHRLRAPATGGQGAQGSGLFDLVRRRGRRLPLLLLHPLRAHLPGRLHRAGVLPGFPEQPFDFEAARAAALTTLPGESCGAASACVMGESPGPVRARDRHEAARPGDRRHPLGLRPGGGAARHPGGLRLPAPGGPGGIAEEMRLPFLPGLRRGQLLRQFRLRPVGKYVIDVCMGTACHVAGAPLVVEAFSQELEIPVGGTTADGLFTLQTVNCVGACALAPVVRIGDDETFGRMGPTEARRLVRKLRKQEVAVMSAALSAVRAAPAKIDAVAQSRGRQGRLPGRRRQDRDPHLRRHRLPRLRPGGPAQGRRRSRWTSAGSPARSRSSRPAATASASRDPSSCCGPRASSIPG